MFVRHDRFSRRALNPRFFLQGPAVDSALDRADYVHWVQVIDERTQAQRERDAQLEALAREAAVAESEAQIAARAAESTRETREALEMLQAEAILREQKREQFAVRQARDAAAQMAAAEAAAAGERARGEIQAEIQAEEAKRQAIQAWEATQPPKTNWMLIGGAGAAALVALAMFTRR